MLNFGFIYAINSKRFEGLVTFLNKHIIDTSFYETLKQSLSSVLLTVTFLIFCLLSSANDRNKNFDCSHTEKSFKLIHLGVHSHMP